MSAVTLLWIYDVGAPRTRAVGASQFATGELQAGRPIAQTFRMMANGLNRVTLYPSGTPSSTARVTATIVRLGPRGSEEGARAEYEREVAATEMRPPSWTFEFPPVATSHNQYFRIALSPAADTGVRFQAVPGDDYPEGSMFVAGQRMPADLAFSTAATRATAVERLGARYAGDYRRIGLLTLAFSLVGFGFARLVAALATAYSPQSE